MSTAIILASASPYRKAQLKQRFGLDLRCIPADIDESSLDNEHPREMAMRLSLAKAQAISDETPAPSIIIAGDQTAALDNELLRKPTNFQSAVSQLSTFSGRELRFYSGVCVLNTADASAIQLDVIETVVVFRNLSETQIRRYLSKDEPFDCLGAFKNESLGIALFTSVTSDDPSALTGLPMIRLNHMLYQLGIDVLTR